MLDRIVGEKWLTAKAVFGLWPANSVGDDVRVQHPQGETTLHFLRQQVDKPAERPDFCLADFIAPPTAAGRTGSARSRSPPASASTRTWRASKPSMTTTTRSC
jgi:cobalamin-dependent methionine synthase I